MMRIFLFLSLVLTIFSCSEETKKETKEESKNQKPEEVKDERLTAVEINNVLSLSQAEAFVLVDSLLNTENLDSMLIMIPEIQIEILAVQQRVETLEANVEGAQEFKTAVLDQINYVVKGLQEDIPTMIKVAKAEELGGRKVADEMYFKWIEMYQVKSKVILKNQEMFAARHNIKM